MSKLVIEIDLSGAAFADAPEVQVSAILDGVADMIQDYGIDTTGAEGRPLRDVNGNVCGSVRLVQ